MVIRGPRGEGWTVVLRRQPPRMGEGWAQRADPYAFELICCECGDDPDLGYCEVSAELQRVRGPYPIADGIAAHENHRGLHPAAGGRYPAPAMTDAG